MADPVAVLRVSGRGGELAGARISPGPSNCWSEALSCRPGRTGPSPARRAPGVRALRRSRSSRCLTVGAHRCGWSPSEAGAVAHPAQRPAPASPSTVTCWRRRRSGVTVGGPRGRILCRWRRCSNDLGKGYPADHSESGETLAAIYSRLMGFAAGDGWRPSPRVRHHLLLPDGRPGGTWTAGDGGDGRRAGTAEQLAPLRALSEADGRARVPSGLTLGRRRSTSGSGSAGSAVTRIEGALRSVPVRPSSGRCWTPACSGGRADGDTIVSLSRPPGHLPNCVAGVLALHGPRCPQRLIHPGMALDEFRVWSA